MIPLSKRCVFYIAQHPGRRWAMSSNKLKRKKSKGLDDSIGIADRDVWISCVLSDGRLPVQRFETRELDRYPRDARPSVALLLSCELVSKNT